MSLWRDISRKIRFCSLCPYGLPLYTRRSQDSAI